MRTTLTLEEDVVVLLKRVQKRRHLKFKDIVNLALRTGLALLDKNETHRFETKGLESGPCLLGTLDNISEVLEVLGE